jgi:peptidylprolyl isomerase
MKHPVAVLALALLTAASMAGAKPKHKAAEPAAPTAPGPPTAADMRTPDPQDLIVIETNKGRVLVELNDLAAPIASARFRDLARKGVYDGRAFFRVIDNFMDQTGDPLDSGLGGSSLPNIQPEFSFRRGADTPVVILDKSSALDQGFAGSLPIASQTMDLGLLTVDHKVQAWGTYCAGVLGIARSDDPASGNSQFFITRTNAQSIDHANHPLDRQYTAFGRVIAGQDVIDSIKAGDPSGGSGQVPPPQDKMLSVKVVADLPQSSRPKVRIVDAASPWARAETAYEKASNGIDFSICDVKLPVEVN